MNAWLIGSLLLTLVFACSTWLQPRVARWSGGRQSDHLLQVLLGDGRKILANHLFVQADVYFHSGYYPSVFDQQHAPTNSSHMAGEEAAAHAQESDAQHNAEEAEAEHERAMDFLGEPQDWIERFGRHFAITEHKHLTAGKEREMLPFLKLSAELDPHRIDTYTVAAFWLSRTLGRPKEAEDFLREGLKANPRSYEILFELGRIYYENYKDYTRARNVWEAALDKWTQQEPGKPKPNLLALDQLLVRLARLEEDQGHYDKAISWLELALEKNASPNPAGLRQQLLELRGKRDSFMLRHKLPSC